MKSGAPTDDAERLSDLIGAVYDCAIDPGRWDQTLEDIRQFFVCANCALWLYDHSKHTTRYNKVIGTEPQWRERMMDYADSITEIWHYLGDYNTRPLDNVLVLRRDLPDEFLFTLRYYWEWAVPQGIEDLIQVILMREPKRQAMFSMGRYGKDGRIGEREVRLLQLLAPHLRRSVAISDLIDMKTLEADALSGTLDTIAAGVILVAEDGAILHANRAARSMFDNSGAVRAVSSRLHARDPAITERLMRAIGIAVSGAAEPGDAGLGIALTHDPETVAVAHVLPVTHGIVRSRLVSRAVAAIFVAGEGAPAKVDLGPIAEAFTLTPAETRLLDRIVRGESLDEAAAALKVAKTTTRTHMARILTKTGTRRQAALVALVNRLAPALRSDGD